MPLTVLPRKHVFALAVATLFAGDAALVQDASPEADAKVIVTGTRAAKRTALDTAAVDIISADSLLWRRPSAARATVASMLAALPPTRPHRSGMVELLMRVSNKVIFIGP